MQFACNCHEQWTIFDFQSDNLDFLYVFSLRMYLIRALYIHCFCTCPRIILVRVLELLVFIIYVPSVIMSLYVPSILALYGLSYFPCKCPRIVLVRALVLFFTSNHVSFSFTSFIKTFLRAARRVNDVVGTF